MSSVSISISWNDFLLSQWGVDRIVLWKSMEISSIWIGVMIVGFIIFVMAFVLMFFHDKSLLRSLQKQHEELKSAEVLRQRFFDEMKMMVYFKDEHHRYLMVNHAFEEFYHLSSNQILGHTDEEIRDNPDFMENKKLADLKLHQGNQRVTFVFESQGQQYEITKFPVPLPNQRKGVGGFIENVTEFRKQQHVLNFQSNHDLLTGLYNRNYVENLFHQTIDPSRLPIAIFLMDVNGLKFVNDVFGHAAGDELLKSVASILLECFPKHATVARFGGDEFIMVVSKTEMNEALRLMQRVKEQFAKIKHHHIPGSISGGVDLIDAIPIRFEDAIAEAETMMYQEKTLDRALFRKEAIQSLVRRLHEESPFEKTHAKNTSSIAKSFGEYLRLTEHECKTLESAGFYHDIGKITLSNKKILSRQKCTPEERGQFKVHPLSGYRILASTDELADIAEIVLEHHEHFDGFGYPKKLKGTEIHFLARILSIVESYDAMTNPNTYQKPRSFEEALEEMKRQEGTQFDPRILDQFLKYIAQKHA